MFPVKRLKKGVQHEGGEWPTARAVCTMLDGQALRRSIPAQRRGSARAGPAKAAIRGKTADTYMSCRTLSMSSQVLEKSLFLLHDTPASLYDSQSGTAGRRDQFHNNAAPWDPYQTQMKISKSGMGSQAVPALLMR
ncbi:hypothetical protein [Burkholderia ubonensis]|uniref:hypothetical protein n=1 Tax=Burkholderia ubonensis TaxID=101571 RepID=UPI0018E027FF|nr:hypothetical protein [Burkholderia ubonensis]